MLGIIGLISIIIWMLLSVVFNAQNLERSEQAALVITGDDPDACEQLESLVEVGINPNFVFNGKSLLERAIEKSDRCLSSTLLKAGAQRDLLGPANKKLLTQLLR